MQRRFNIPIDLSDHTLDDPTAMAIVILGACIVEKHLILNRSRGDPGESFSQEPSKLIALCIASKKAWQTLGQVEYRLKLSGQENAKFCHFLYFIKYMNKGDIIDETCIRSIRPSYALAPNFFDRLVGRKLDQSVSSLSQTLCNCL